MCPFYDEKERKCNVTSQSVWNSTGPSEIEYKYCRHRSHKDCPNYKKEMNK